jgi:hypothetical protein
MDSIISEEKPLLLNYDVRPTFKTTRDITRHDLWKMCMELDANLERRSEGGLLFHNDKDGYNCIRFNRLKFGRIVDDTLETWGNDTTVIATRGQRVSTIFKTFIYTQTPSHKCAPWTYATIQRVYDVFATNGFKVVKKALKRDFDKVPSNVTFRD